MIKGIVALSEIGGHQGLVTRPGGWTPVVRETLGGSGAADALASGVAEAVDGHLPEGSDGGGSGGGTAALPTTTARTRTDHKHSQQ
jgi:hypothetical protein